VVAGSRRGGLALMVAVPLLAGCAGSNWSSDGDGPPGHGWFVEPRQTYYPAPTPRLSSQPADYDDDTRAAPVYVVPAPRYVAPPPRVSEPEWPETSPVPPASPPALETADPTCGWWRLCNLWAGS
jgi:hypothetical protein